MLRTNVLAFLTVGVLASVVPDTARLVVIKANIGIVKASGSGVVTDSRVVRAVALLVHEAYDVTVCPTCAGEDRSEWSTFTVNPEKGILTHKATGQYGRIPTIFLAKGTPDPR